MICSLRDYKRSFLSVVIRNTMIERLYGRLPQNIFREAAGDLDYCVSRASPERNPVNIPLRKTENVALTNYIAACCRSI